MVQHDVTEGQRGMIGGSFGRGALTALALAAGWEAACNRDPVPGTSSPDPSENVDLGEYDQQSASDLSSSWLSFRLGPLHFEYGRGPPGTGDLGAYVPGDFNGDGVIDFAVTFAAYLVPEDAGVRPFPAIQFLSGRGGEATSPILDCSVRAPGGTVAGDFNQDGRLDLFLGGCYPVARVYLGRGDGTFESGPPVGAQYRQSVAADFDGDGRIDVAAGSYQELDVLLSNGDGSLRRVPIPASPSRSSQPVAVELNGDGHPDLLFTTDSVPVRVQVSLGRGNGTMNVLAEQDVGLSDAVAGDFDGDGRLDLAGSAGFAAGRGDGTFAPARRSGPYPAGLVGDFDGDGRLDMASVGHDSSDRHAWVYVARGFGDGRFAAAEGFQVPNGREDVAGIHPFHAGDLNGDGKPDLWGETWYGEGVSWVTLLNTSK